MLTLSLSRFIKIQTKKRTIILNLSATYYLYKRQLNEIIKFKAMLNN